MAFSGSVVLLLVAYGIACAVLIIGTASPDWAHIKSDLPFTAPWNTSSEVATDNYVDEDAVPTSTGSGESDRYVTDWSISPFGYSDNNADNFYWIRPNCRIYDEDYDFVGVLSTNGQCDEQRTMQIFALFAIFFSFFAFISLFLFGMGKTPKQNPLVFSLLASICGIISMSIFVDQKQHRRGDFFKAGTDKFTYGYSMGLFTAGWVLSIVNTALTAQAKLGGEGDKANLTGIRPLQAILIFSFFIAFCTIVIGTGSPEWAYRRVDGEIDVSPFGFYIQSEGRFYWLRPNCKIYEPDGSLYEPMPTIRTRSLCDEFRTQQVFAIFACVLSFLGLVSALVHSYHKGGNVGPVLFGFLTGVAGVTAMAMFIDQKDGSRGFFEQDGGDKWDYGYSIGLFTGGWILALVAGIIALFSKKNDEYAAPGQSQPNTANTSIQSGV